MSQTNISARDLGRSSNSIIASFGDGQFASVSAATRKIEEIFAIVDGHKVVRPRTSTIPARATSLEIPDAFQLPSEFTTHGRIPALDSLEKFVTHAVAAEKQFNQDKIVAGIALNIIFDNELFLQKGFETFEAYVNSLGVHYSTTYRWRENAKVWQGFRVAGIEPPTQAANLQLIKDVPIEEIGALLCDAKEIGHGKITGNAIKSAKAKRANAQVKIGAPNTVSAASDAFLKIRELNNAILANLGLDERLQVRAWIAAEHGPILSAESVIAHKHPENLERK